MISFSGNLEIFLLVDCCDMRKGFNGLYGLVSTSFGEDHRCPGSYRIFRQTSSLTFKNYGFSAQSKVQTAKGTIGYIYGIRLTNEAAKPAPVRQVRQTKQMLEQQAKKAASLAEVTKRSKLR